MMWRSFWSQKRSLSLDLQGVHPALRKAHFENWSSSNLNCNVPLHDLVSNAGLYYNIKLSQLFKSIKIESICGIPSK